MPYDAILDMIEAIPYEERASGGSTTQALAQMLVAKAAQKMARSKEFQSQSADRNKYEFSPPFTLPSQQQPDQLEEHPMTPPWQPLDQMQNASPMEALQEPGQDLNSSEEYDSNGGSEGY